VFSVRTRGDRPCSYDPVNVPKPVGRFEMTDMNEPKQPLESNQIETETSHENENPELSRLADYINGAESQLVAGTLALLALFSMLYPDSFATADNFGNMIRVAGILMIVAIGQSFTLVIGGFDISVGAQMGFASIVAALCMTSSGGLVDGVAIALLAGLVVGLTNGILIGCLRVTPFVATLGTLTFLRGLANELGDGGTISGLPKSLALLGRGNWGVLPSTLCIAAIAFAVGWFIFARTRAGLYIFAIGGSRETARLAGVPVAFYEVLAYTLCGLFSAIGGIMLTSRIGVGQASLGTGYELQSIATAVIGGVAIGGGIGRLSGVALGVVLLVVLTTGLDIGGVNEFYQEMVTGLVLIIAVLIARFRGKRPGMTVRRTRKQCAKTTTRGNPSEPTAEVKCR
jgi:ribose/xylose/arabinose/galactoside ABC-type transport system permease subunit